MTFPANDIPADSFWSVTNYILEGWFFANKDNIYRLNAENTKVDSDGNIVIIFSNQEVDGNWLPSPDGLFYFDFRFYLPKEGALDGSFRKLVTIEEIK
jgi:hypothetical protein